MNDTTTVILTGREPRLSERADARGGWRLSLRGLATMLNVLPPESVALDAVAAALRSKEFYVRYNAGQLLARRGDRAARLVLQDALGADDPRTRASAARHLYGFSWFTAEPLFRQALGDADSRVREAAVYALCDLRQLEACRLLTSALQHEEDGVRAAAAWGLRDCQDPAAVPVMEAVLLAKDPDVRVAALEALGASDTPEALPVVRRAIDADAEPDVIYAAGLSLLELAGAACLAEVAALVAAREGREREALLRALFHATNYLKIDVTGSAAADALVAALDLALADPLPQTRLAAVFPLAWLRRDDTPPILKAAYARETDVETRAEMRRVIASLMDETAGGTGASELLDS